MTTFKQLQTDKENLYYRFVYNHITMTNGNVSQAARNAEMDRSNFLRLLRRYNINPSNYRGSK